MGGQDEDLRGLHPWSPRPASCCPGWSTLLERFGEGLARLLPPEALADLRVEVGEERGRLRLQARGAGRFGPQVAALVRQAEEASEATCQQCGAPGGRAERGGWWATLCEEHERQGTWL